MDGCVPVTSLPGFYATGIGKASVLWGQLHGLTPRAVTILSAALLRNHLILPHVNLLPVVHTQFPG